jgi:hypothetical protein
LVYQWLVLSLQSPEMLATRTRDILGSDSQGAIDDGAVILLRHSGQRFLLKKDFAVLLPHERPSNKPQ